MSGTYEDLRAWQHAMELVFDVYEATRTFPRDEIYGPTNLMRRASVSIASNIAEGKGRSSDKELLQFLCRARGSLYEVQTQLRIATHLGYLNQLATRQLTAEAAETGRSLNGLIKAFTQRATQADSLEPKA